MSKFKIELKATKVTSINLDPHRNELKVVW